MATHVSGKNLQTFWGKIKNWIDSNFYKKNEVDDKCSLSETGTTYTYTGG